MNKQEILAKNKKDGLDEREQTVYSRSFGFGAVVVAVLCLAFSVYRAFHGENFFEFGAIITAYLSTTFFYQYKDLRKTKYLIAAVATFVIAVACIIAFVVFE